MLGIYFFLVCLVCRFLRVDTLSLLLSMGNVAANSDVLVVDMAGGLLTGAVAERLGGLEDYYFLGSFVSSNIILIIYL